MTSNACSQKQNDPHDGIGGTGARDRIPESASADRAEKNRVWLSENTYAILAENAYIGKHGLPLTKYRLF